MSKLETICLKELRKWKFKDSSDGHEYWSIEPEEEIDLFIKTTRKWLTQKQQNLKVFDLGEKCYNAKNDLINELLQSLSKKAIDEKHE